MKLNRYLLGFLRFSFAVLLVVLPVFLTAYWLSPGDAGACGNAFGSAPREKEEEFLRDMFVRERLPEALQVDVFRCSGFQDKQVDATFRISAAEGQALFEALQQTFHAPQNNPYFPDKQKSMHVSTTPNFKRAVFVLPAERPMHVRDVKVSLPHDGSSKAVVEVILYQR